MEELIKQAFIQVEFIGQHVQEGHYDLIGPDGDIILPSIWERSIQPDWSVTMQIWAMDKMPPLRRPGMQGANPAGNMPGHIPGHMPGQANGGVRYQMPGMAMPLRQGMPIPNGAGVGPGPGVGVGPGVGPGAGVPGAARPPWAMGGQPTPGPAPRGIHVVNGDLRHEKKKSSSKQAAGLLAFIGGKQAKPKKYVAPYL